MVKDEAREVLEKQLECYRKLSAELLHLLDETQASEVVGASGATYQVEIQAVWDGKPHGNIRVLGEIDDGGWDALQPLTSDFILSPDGSFVGE